VREGRVKKLSGTVAVVECGELTFLLLLPLYLSLSKISMDLLAVAVNKVLCFSKKSLLCILKHGKQLN
jgi:hypothetical protein